MDLDGQIIGTDKVVLSSSADMIDFRDAVKEKYKDSLLQGVSPISIRVYKNRDAFDKRNAVVEKEEPLDRKTSLNELDSETDVLVVVVPPPAILSSSSEVEGKMNN